MASEKLDYAKAVWWNGSSVYVRCPECEKVHCHGFQGDYAVKHRRVSHCAQQRYTNYKIQFPFNRISGEAGYEIDKIRALFVAGGEDPSEYFATRDDEQLPSLVPDFSNCPKWTEATESVHRSEEMIGIRGGFTSRPIDWVTTAVITGNINIVRRYLDKSKDADIFVHGVDAWIPQIPQQSSDEGDDDEEHTNEDGPSCEDTIETKGNTALHFAAGEMFPDIVKLLLEYGANPNVVNKDGRTPLAEAALWGRRDNVELLLEHGAEKEKECYLCNGQRGRAIEFARPLDANKEERYSRSGRALQNYKEDTYQRDRDRKAIVRLLQDEGAEDLDQSNRNPAGFAFTKSPLDERLLTLVAHFDIPHKWKTIGVLYRGSQFPTVAAMSGWSHQAGPEHNVQIAGRDWTDEVLRLCKTIKYVLPPHQYDRGVRGRYHACHAEKQLVAYFVDKHIFLPHETCIPEPSEPASLANLSLEEHSGNDELEREEREEMAKRLSALKSYEPPISLKRAIIMVCRPICPDCKLFVARVNEWLGMDIKLHHRCVDEGCQSCKR